MLAAQADPTSGSADRVGGPVLPMGADPMGGSADALTGNYADPPTSWARDR